MEQDLKSDEEKEFYIMRHKNFNYFPTLTSDFSEFFNNPTSNSWSTLSNSFSIDETEEHVKIMLSAPGTSKESFDIDIQGEILEVRHEPKEATIFTKSFTKSFSLPADLNLSTVEAEYKDGVLYIEIKKREKDKPKKIEVK